MHGSKQIGVALVIVCLAAVELVGITTAAADGQPAASCDNVAGDLDAVAIPQIADGAVSGFHVVVTASRGDLATSSITADLDVVSVGGAWHLEGAHHFALAGGRVVDTSDNVRIGPNGAVNDTLTVVSGGDGALHTHGTVDLATGAVHLDYHGRICG